MENENVNNENENNESELKPTEELEIKNKPGIVSRIFSSLSTVEGKIMFIIGFIIFQIITTIPYGRFFLSGNINYGPVLLDRVYQGFPLNYQI
tara:strand:+ start:67 stop:345 length:279 start_codon:yes stop_codon:yes gene_type:complete